MKITEETRKALEENTLSNFDVYTKLVDSVRSSVAMLDRTEEYMLKNNHSIPDSNYYLRRISEYTILLGLVWLDITAGFRIYLNAKENYETIYSTKQLLITINEGFKQIYNYVSIDSNGNLKTKPRNHSFWVKDIGTIVNDKLAHLVDEYLEITTELDLYDDDELKNMRGPRNLFVHYDIEASKVYDELINLDIEKMAIKMMPFMKILSRMVLFGRKVLEEYNSYIKKNSDDFYDTEHQKIESLKVEHGNSPQLLELFNQIQADLMKFKNS